MARGLTRGWGLRLVAVVAILSGCTVQPSDRSAPGPSEGQATAGPLRTVPSPLGQSESCEPVPWPLNEGDDYPAPGDLVGQFESRANPVLARVSIDDGRFLVVEDVLDDRFDTRLSAGQSYPLQTLAPDGRGHDWWQFSGATHHAVPAIVVVPIPLTASPSLLATFTDDFQVDAPCVYEADRQRAASELGVDGRQLLSQLLDRAQDLNG